MKKRGFVIAKRILTISLIFISIFLITNVLASTNTNTKEFKKIGDYGEITIKNNLGGKLAEYTLEKNSEQCLINCFAEGSATLYTSGQLFSDLKFYNTNQEIKNLQYNQIFIETTESYQQETDVTETTCSNGQQFANGSYEKVCTTKVIGTNIETKYKTYWRDYNGEILLSGTYKWKIEAQKQLTENIDWIATAFNNELSEWAWWDSSWSKKKSINITENNNSVLNNYSILLNVTYDSDMNNDFSDLRFVNSTEDSELSYYIENKVDGDYADVWVKFPLIQANTNTTFYMYYNNSEASNTTSNFNNAFVYADDFETNTSSRYDFYKTAGCSGFDVTNGKLKINYKFGPSCSVSPKDEYQRVNSSYMIEVLISNSEGYSGPYGYSSNKYYEDDGYSMRMAPIIDTMYLGTDAVFLVTKTGLDLTINKSYYGAISFYGNSNKTGYLTDNTNVTSVLTVESITTTKGFYGMMAVTGGGVLPAYFDWFRVRPIVRNEPTYHVSEIEETQVNTPPTHSQPILNTSTGKNLSTEDLTCYNQSTNDEEGDKVINIYNWYKDGQSVLSLNLPFEGGSNSSYTKDYSGYENNDGTVSSYAVWKSSGGYDGKGAYDVTLDGATITIPHKVAVNPTDEITVMAWLKYNDTYCDSNYGGSAARPIAKGQNEAFELQTYEWIGGDCTARFCVNNTCPDLGTTSETAKGNWAHIAGSFNGTHINTYFNGDLDVSIEYSGKIPFITDDLIIGDWTSNFGRGFIGIIDEVMVFNHSLSAEQIQRLYEGKTNLIVSEETGGGDNWTCQVTPNDGEDDGVSLNSSGLDVLWAIEFNVTYGEDGSQETNFNIDCDNGFSASSVSSPYEVGFEPESYVCMFSKLDRYDRTVIFTADGDKTIDVTLSEKKSLTVEEHTWLEAIYECIINKDCDLYNLLLEINQTTGNIWEQTKPTDESVITFENVTNKIVNSTHNLSIDYTVNIPIKAGYSLGAYLPVRIGYWFMDENNETCYNQGYKPTGVEEPYCQPLVIETLGPMGGSVNFTVVLRPELPAGDYSIKRIIDIDPLGVWYNYGQETIGTFALTETLSDSGIGLERTGEVNPRVSDGGSSSSSGNSGGGGGTTTVIKERETIIKVIQDSEEDESIGEEESEEVDSEEVSGRSWLTGGVIGTNLLAGSSLIFIVAMLCGTFIIFIIVRKHQAFKLNGIK